MKLQNTLLMAAFGLLSALTVHTAHAQAVTAQVAKATSTPISALPKTISEPGTYVLSSNLSCTGGGISIASNISGPVTLNLHGFTISGGGVSNSLAIFITSPNEYPISVKNGTITNCGFGVLVVANNVDLSNLTFSDIQSAQNATCIDFGNTNSCTVRNCTFSNAMYGIASGSPTNNHYTNLLFTNVTWSLFISGSPVQVGDLHFESSN